jgi:hypothetical protein
MEIQNMRLFLAYWILQLVRLLVTQEFCSLKTFLLIIFETINFVTNPWKLQK